jgi:biopolymer transport protein ExbD
MARRRRKIDENIPTEFDMTPMIDVTFQLIVFFLVANDLTKKEVVDLKLPQAVHGQEDLGKEDQRIILNIRKPPDPDQKLPLITVKGIEYDLKSLERLMLTAADRKREAGPGTPSEVYVLIRADRETPWHHVQHVMQVCANEKIQLWKLQFATTRRDDGKASSVGETK